MEWEVEACFHGLDDCMSTWRYDRMDDQVDYRCLGWEWTRYLGFATEFEDYDDCEHHSQSYHVRHLPFIWKVFPRGQSSFQLPLH